MSSDLASSEPRPTPRWLHAWAILTVCATLPLLLLGAEVTTKKVGMVDPVGFRPPWHLWTVRDLWDRGLGYLIEHSHRVAGYTVGLCIIVLAVGLWLRETRRWVRWLGAIALGGVIVQGLLGGFRVQLNALMGPKLALVHGSFAPVVFGLLVSLALVTSGAWLASAAPADPSVRRWTSLCAALAYVQIVLGGMVRHTEAAVGPRLHLLAAFAVAGVVLWTARVVYDAGVQDRMLKMAVAALVLLTVLQIGLGVEAWLARFPATPEWAQGLPVAPAAQLPRSLHYLIGAWLFSAAVATALAAHRGLAWAPGVRPAPVSRLEGAA